VKQMIKRNKIILRTAAVFLLAALVLGLAVQHGMNGKHYYIKDAAKVLERADVTVLYESGSHAEQIKIINGEKGWFAVKHEDFEGPFEGKFDIVDKDGNLLLASVAKWIYDWAGEGYLLLERTGEIDAYLNLETLEIKEVHEDEHESFSVNMHEAERTMRDEAGGRLELDKVKLTENFVFGKDRKTGAAQVYTHAGKLLFEGSMQEEYLGALCGNILVVWDNRENTYRYYTMGLQGIEDVTETGEVFCFMDFEDGYAAACRPRNQEDWYTQRAEVTDYDPLDYTMESGTFVYSYLDENLNPVLDFVMRDASLSQNGYAVVSGWTSGYVLLDLTGKGGRPWTLGSN